MIFEAYNEQQAIPLCLRQQNNLVFTKKEFDFSWASNSLFKHLNVDFRN